MPVIHILKTIDNDYYGIRGLRLLTAVTRRRGSCWNLKPRPCHGQSLHVSLWAVRRMDHLRGGIAAEAILMIPARTSGERRVEELFEKITETIIAVENNRRLTGDSDRRARDSR